MEQNLNVREPVTIGGIIDGSSTQGLPVHQGVLRVSCLLWSRVCKSRTTMDVPAEKPIPKFRMTGTHFGKSEGLHIQRNDQNWDLGLE